MPSASARSKLPMSWRSCSCSAGEPVITRRRHCIGRVVLVGLGDHVGEEPAQDRDRRLALAARRSAPAARRSRRRGRGRPRPPCWGSSRRTCAERCRRPRRCRRSSTCSNPRSSNSAIACSTICSRVRCFLRSRSPGSASPMPHTIPCCRRSNLAVIADLHRVCDNWGMALLLGRLAGAAAHHWKRSLALVVVALASLALLSSLGSGFSDSFTTPGTESQQAYDLLAERFPARAGDTATVVFSVQDGTLREPERAAAIAEAVGEIAGQPHVTAAANPLETEGQVSRDGRIAFTQVQYDQPAAELAKAPGERLAEVAPITERAGIATERNGQIVDQAEQADGARRRADRRRGRDHRPHARLPLGRGDAADARERRHRARGRDAAAHLRHPLRRVPQLRADARRDARPRRRDRLRAADRRALPRAARRRRRRPPCGARRQRDRRHVGDRGRCDRRRGDRRAARHRHPVRRPHGPGVGDHGRRRRGRRRHRAPRPDGRVREAAAPPQARARRAVGGLRPLGPPDRRPPVARRRARHARARSCSRRRSPRCASASPTTATTRATAPRARPTTRSPRASAPASTARSCSPPSCPRAATRAPCSSASSAPSPPTRTSPPPRRRSATRPATRRRSP